MYSFGFSWIFLAIATPVLWATAGAQESCDVATEQPILSSIYPPSGSGGTDFLLTGKLLDQVNNIDVGSSNTGSIKTRNDTNIIFNVIGSIIQNGPATVFLFPLDDLCSNVSVTIDLRRRGKTIFL